MTDLAYGRIKRLIVTMPPRHGKSELCSRYFPAWYLGTFPNNPVILCSYEAGFAATWGGKARDLLQQFGRALFGVDVRDDSSARDEWRLKDREGVMVTAGVGGPITGKGAKLLIIDDPIKNAAEAASETFRRRLWDWWISTAYTRLEPDGSALVIQTRWNEKDLVGQLLGQDEGDEEGSDERWEVLNLPAIAEAGDAMGRSVGEALWPERWPKEKLLKRMRRLGSYFWAALFQQRPAPPEGNYFKRHWFVTVERDLVPAFVRLVRCWDLAATAEGENGNADPDWLAGVLMGVDEFGIYYLLDVFRDRLSPEGVERAIANTAKADGKKVAVRIEQEGAASGKIVARTFTRMLDGYDCRFVPVPRASKFIRSGPFNAACERADVKIMRGGWNADFIEELVGFPHGAHDDQVDAAVGAYTALIAAGDWGGNEWARLVSYEEQPEKYGGGNGVREMLLKKLRGEG